LGGDRKEVKAMRKRKPPISRRRCRHAQWTDGHCANEYCPNGRPKCPKHSYRDRQAPCTHDPEYPAWAAQEDVERWGDRFLCRLAEVLKSEHPDRPLNTWSKDEVMAELPLSLTEAQREWVRVSLFRSEGKGRW
jgi:hypothetical protein